MDFESYLNKIVPDLEKIAMKYNSHRTYLDKEDLLSEMVLHLFKEYKNGNLIDKTKSYIIQSCYFYLLNFLRVNVEKQKFISLTEPMTEEGLTFEEILSDNFASFDDIIEEKIFLRKIMNDGLTKIEKDIFNLTLNHTSSHNISFRLGR